MRFLRVVLAALLLAAALPAADTTNKPRHKPPRSSKSKPQFGSKKMKIKPRVKGKRSSRRSTPRSTTTKKPAQHRPANAQ